MPAFPAPRQRYIKQAVVADLREKMVFIGGPRQVGKRTFALGLLPRFQQDHLRAQLDSGVGTAAAEMPRAYPGSI